ncbi:MAG: hypothetical protein ACI86C_000940 [Candidatus Latescibacterota bacterium]|jgi:hypothetical protein
MTTENNSTKFKVLIGILSLLLIALAVYTAKLYNDSKDNEMSLISEKAKIEGELEDLIANYDEIIQDNELKDKDLLAARERIFVLLDSVKTAEANVGLIERYRAEIGRLKLERTQLFRKADSLIVANQQLLMERDSTYVVLENTQRAVDSVSESNTLMTETIKRASVIGATDLRGEAVIVRNSGKIVDTKRSSRADKIRACFTLAPNAIAQKGDRLLYVQVYNPNKTLLGDKGSVTYDDQEIDYSAASRVFYENEELDVCILISADEADLVEGRYIINVFDGPSRIATANMILK